MLKITPYLGILVLIVSIAGLWYPILGYFLLIVFATLLITSISKGRWFCGNLCPRGSYHDFWLGKVKNKKNIPTFFRNNAFRWCLVIIMMGFMFIRIYFAYGAVDKVGTVFVFMCLATTGISTILGLIYSPRAWCTFCPMGTVQKLIGGKRQTLKFIKELCVDCGACDKVCPMDLDVRKAKEDCIKCGRCVKACKKKAIEMPK